MELSWPFLFLSCPESFFRSSSPFCLFPSSSALSLFQTLWPLYSSIWPLLSLMDVELSSSSPCFSNSSVSLLDFSLSAMKCSLCLLTLFLVAALNFSFFYLDYGPINHLGLVSEPRNPVYMIYITEGLLNSSNLEKMYSPLGEKSHYNAIVPLTISH